MKKLGEILASVGLADEDQRNRALLRQVRNRGRFGTALLEEGVPEEEVARALSHQHHVPAAPLLELENIRPDTARLIPVKLATRLEVVPFRRAGRTLALAMRNPQDLPAVDEVATLTGLVVEPHVAAEARIYMALAKYYGLKLESRYAALARRIALRSGERAAFAPDTPTPVPPSVQLRPPLRVVGPARPESGPAYPARPSLTFERLDPWAAGEAATASSGGPHPSETIFEESISAQGAAVLRELDRVAKSPPAPAPVAVAPPPPEENEPIVERRQAERRAPELPPLPDRLGAAETRDEIAEAILEEASRHVRRAALFVVQPDRIIGWAAWPVPPEGLRSFELTFSEPSVFATLRNTEGFYVGPYPDLAGTLKTLKSLGSDGLGSMAVVPVNLKGKTVLFLYGESESYTRPPSVPELKRLAAMAATALEVILLKNRLRNL